MHTLRRCAICDVASIAYACAWSFSRDTCHGPRVKARSGRRTAARRCWQRSCARAREKGTERSFGRAARWVGSPKRGRGPTRPHPPTGWRRRDVPTAA